MKSVPTQTQNEINQSYGSEPLIVVRLDFAGIRWFADRDVTIGSINATGDIKSVSPISSRIGPRGMGSISRVTVTLLDPEEELRTLLNTNRLEFVDCTLYHHSVGTTELVEIVTGKQVQGS